MRLGFDLDGTLADLHGALARTARNIFPDIDPGSLPQSVAPDASSLPEAASPVAPAGPPPLSTDALTSSQQRELWKKVCSRENFWETLDEIEPGALARL